MSSVSWLQMSIGYMSADCAAHGVINAVFIYPKWEFHTNRVTDNYIIYYTENAHVWLCQLEMHL